MPSIFCLTAGKELFLLIDLWLHPLCRQDYFEDYQYLKPKNLESVVTLAQDRVACCYIESMLRQQNVVLRSKVKFETAEDRRKAAEKIRGEAEQVKRFFRRVASDVADFDSPFDAISQLSELLRQGREGGCSTLG